MKRKLITIALAFGLTAGTVAVASAHTIPGSPCHAAHGIVSDGGGYGHSTSRLFIGDETSNLHKYTHKHYTRVVAKGTWLYHGTTVNYCYY